jgi:hypothetical protein
MLFDVNVFGWSLAIEFHQFKPFGVHWFRTLEVARRSLVLGGFTLDLVTAVKK